MCVTKMFKDKFPGKNNNNDLEWTKDIGLVWTKSVLVANLQPNDRRSAGTSLTLEGLKKQQPTNTTLNHSLLFLPTQTEPYRKEPVQKLSRDASDLPTRFMIHILSASTQEENSSSENRPCIKACHFNTNHTGVLPQNVSAAEIFRTPWELTHIYLIFYIY